MFRVVLVDRLGGRKRPENGEQKGGTALEQKTGKGVQGVDRVNKSPLQGVW